MGPCPHCASAHPGWRGPGCPALGLGRARAPADAPRARAAEPTLTPARVGDYDVLDRLGSGGTGVVYRALEALPPRVVALKMIHFDRRITDDERVRFSDEVAFLSRFEHPNIVRIYDAKGVHDGQPFYTMQFVEGGSLAQHRARFRDASKAARLIATVARAVQFCHDAKPDAVLHRDLKPANILLGPEDHPYLTDFGIAKALGGDAQTQSETIAGTVAYMAPEQLRGRSVTGSDVYGLGAVLYELLTGTPPFGTGSVPELSQRILSEELVPVRQRVRDVPRDLAAVCHAALEHDVDRRYRSAAELADDLERVLRQESPLLPQTSQWQRARRWALRHPLISIGLTGTVLLLVGFALAALRLVHAHEIKSLRSALWVNAFAARAQAGAILNELRERRDQVRRAADYISQTTSPIASGCAVPAEELIGFLSGFDGMTLFRTDGYAVARWPEPVLGLPLPFTFRDYFRGASALGRAGTSGVYVAPAYRAEGRQGSAPAQFALSAPVFQGDGTFCAVLLAGRSTASALGSVVLDDALRSGRLTAVLGPRGVDRRDRSVDANRGRFMMLVHPRLSLGQERELPRAQAQLLARAYGTGRAPGAQFEDVDMPVLEIADYRDPTDPARGRWLAAFAPVGGTGYVVLVQSRYQDALRELTAFWNTTAIVAAVVAAGLLCLWLVMVRLNHPARRWH
jgi:eukaryotic-like serine/threonine-protein kinase